MNTKIDQLYKTNPESVISITQKATDSSNLRIVRAPLPDGFGMSVGSAYTDPQNIDVAAQAQGGSRVSNALSSAGRLLATATGFSTKITQRSNVFYSGPEPTEVSFDLRFDAYYDAYYEVLAPAANLMQMSVGVEYPLSELNETAAEALETISSADDGKYSSFTEGFGFIRSAGVCEIKFGKTMTIARAYVSSVGVKFSNVLDNRGYPMSAECSVTIKVIRNPTQSEVNQYFGGAFGGNQ